MLGVAEISPWLDNRTLYCIPPVERVTGRIDSVKPPSHQPEGSPLERMSKVTRCVIGVPKDEAVPPKRTKRRLG